jgi:RND family efflux transporter MFP subunit
MKIFWIKRLLLGLSTVALLLPVAGTAEELSAFDCVIEPNMVVELSSDEDGIIEQVFVDRGDRVEADQVVAKLESGVEEASLNYASERAAMEAEIHSHEVSWAYGLKNQKRIISLQKKQAVSLSELDRVRAETRIEKYKLQQARESKRLAELEQARSIETLKRHTIHSPIKGVVVERYLNPGESAEDKPILKLAQINPLRVEVVLPVAQFGKIRKGQGAVVYPEAGIGGEYESTVSIVDQVLDAASGTFRVRLSLPNPDYALTSGLRCSIEFKDQPSRASSEKARADDFRVAKGR